MKRGSKHTVTLPQNRKFIDFGMHNSWRKGPQNVPIFVGTFPPGVIWYPLYQKYDDKGELFVNCVLVLGKFG